MKLLGKQGLQTETIIKLALGLVVIVTILLIVSGKLTLNYKTVGELAENVEEGWNLIQGQETHTQKTQRLQAEKEFLAFYHPFVTFINNCLSNGQQQCICNFTNFTLFPEKYAATLLQRKDRSYYSLPYSLTIPERPRILEDANVHPVNPRFTLCFYNGNDAPFYPISQISVSTRKRQSQQLQFAFPSQERTYSYLLHNNLIQLYKLERDILCFMPKDTVLPERRQYGPKGIVSKPVPSCTKS